MKFPVFAVIAIFITGCDKWEPVERLTSTGPTTVIASNASVDASVVFVDPSQGITCRGRGADAVFAESNSMTSVISITKTNSNSDNSGLSSGVGETEMSGRTPGILFSRELFFRTCEFSGNYKLSYQDAAALFAQASDAAVEVIKAEIANTQIQITDGIAIQNGATETVAPEQAPDQQTSDQ